MRDKTKSDMDYFERVKLYVNLDGISNRADLVEALTEARMLGKVRQYKQINIIARELDLTVRGKPIEHDTYKEETYFRKTKSRTIYRDIINGRFMKKPK